MARAAAKAERAKPAAEEDLRARILKASVALIDEEGLASLSMREVARRAGVSHQAPYHHFDDRAAILAALAEEGFAELKKRMRVAREQASTDVVELLERMGRNYVEFALAFPAHFRIMFRPELVVMEQFPEAHCRADEAFNELVVAVHDYVAKGKGWEGKEEALISLCWSLSHGLASLMLDGPLKAKAPQAAEDIEAHVTRVMRAFRTLAHAGHMRGDEA